MSSAETVAALIEEVARRCGAPESFVRDVHRLFAAKGIAPSAPAAPFRAAIIETFEREAAIRVASAGLGVSVTAFASSIEELEQVGQVALDDLRRMRAHLERSTTRLPRDAGRGTPPRSSSQRPSDDRFDGFLVKGPGDLN